jgi:hypothetical protein
MITQIDSILFSNYDEKRVILMNAASNFALVLGSNTFTWGSSIELAMTSSGVMATVAAGGIVVAEGETVYVLLPHPMIASASVSIAKATALGSDRSKFPLCVRRNNKLYFFNGIVITGS